MVTNDPPNLGIYAEDVAITAKINAALLAEPGIKVLDFNIEITKGITTLKGTLDSSENK